MNNNLKIENRSEKLRKVTDPFVTVEQASSRKYGYSLKQQITSKPKEEISKIGRRYSFDDNGGGYQGL